MGKYDRQIASARRVVAAKGRLCTWRETTNENNPEKPWSPGEATTVDTAVSIVFLPASGGAMREFVATIAGTDIKAGNDTGLMAAVSFVPTTRAVILADDGTTVLRTVSSIDVIAPDGEPILYVLNFAVAS